MVREFLGQSKSDRREPAQAVPRLHLAEVTVRDGLDEALPRVERQLSRWAIPLQHVERFGSRVAVSMRSVSQTDDCPRGKVDAWWFT